MAAVIFLMFVSAFAILGVVQLLTRNRNTAPRSGLVSSSTAKPRPTIKKSSNYSSSSSYKSSKSSTSAKSSNFKKKPVTKSRAKKILSKGRWETGASIQPKYKKALKKKARSY